MKKKIFSLLFLTSILLYAQDAKHDSAHIHVIETPLNFSSYFNPLRYLPNTYFDNELNTLSLKANFLNDSSSILMQTRMQLALFSAQPGFDSKTDLLNPMYKSYVAGQSNSFLKEVLGAVQVGAVGFLAYKHIEKYYIKKKK
jgi:hypothetical protein